MPQIFRLMYHPSRSSAVRTRREGEGVRTLYMGRWHAGKLPTISVFSPVVRGLAEIMGAESEK